MVVIWGQRMYGRIDRFGGSHVATRFFHIYYVPLIPLSSWLVLEEQAEGGFLGSRVPLQLRSVLLTWTRVASVLAALGAMGSVLAMRAATPSALFGTGLYVAAAMALVVYAWGRLGTLSRDEKAARAVYADFSGRFVDVGLLGDDRSMVLRRASEELDRHVGKHATASYREAPQAGWREIATRPDVRDVPLLRAALTRCRIEQSYATGPAHTELERDHAKIFANLVAADPTARSIEQYELKTA